MASKKISELSAKTPVAADVIPVADPSTGIAGKSTCYQTFAAGAGNTGVITNLNGSFALVPGSTYISGSTANNVVLSSASIHLLSTSNNLDITGIAPPAGIASNPNGRLIYLINNNDTHNISLKVEDAGSTASNRIVSHNGNQVTLGPSHICLAIYSASLLRWRVWDLT